MRSAVSVTALLLSFIAFGFAAPPMGVAGGSLAVGHPAGTRIDRELRTPAGWPSAVAAGSLARGGEGGAEPGVTFVVDSTGDEGDADAGDGICDTAAATCTLRAAIQEANASPDKDTINFQIGSGVRRIVLDAILPPITEPVVIDGSTQPGFQQLPLQRPLIMIDGSELNGYDGLAVSGGDSEIRWLILGGFAKAIYLVNGDGNTVEHNWIGLNPTGNGAEPNQTGVVVTSASNVIGPRNVISGSTLDGVFVQGEGNDVSGNSIGTNAIGGPLPNGRDGVRVGDFSAVSENTIAHNKQYGVDVLGESNSIDSNHIFKNEKGGIYLLGSNVTGNVIAENRIGTDSTGAVGLGNDGDGVYLGGPGNTVEDNTIAGNVGNGVAIWSPDNSVVGNEVGFWTKAGATAGGGSAELSAGARAGPPPAVVPTSKPMGNDGHGVSIIADGPTLIEGNTIAFNGKNGVWVLTGDGHSILSNVIYSNGPLKVRRSRPGLGIDLADCGGCSGAVTPNDTKDPDTGPNGLQNYPVLTSTAPASNHTKLRLLGRLESTPNTTFRVEFFLATTHTLPGCDKSGYGEASRYLGFKNVTVGATGKANFVATFPLVIPYVPGRPMATATATAPDGSTSEFARCLKVLR